MTNQALYLWTKSYLLTLFPDHKTKQKQKPIKTLSMMVSGILLGPHIQLFAIAMCTPLDIQLLSIVRRFERFVADDRINVKVFFKPFVIAMSECLGNETAYLLIDCTQVGRKCRTLLIGLYYHGTVLPLVWKTLKGKKGHVNGNFQKELLEKIYSQFRYHKQVVVLGDAEFSNQDVITWCQSANWDFVFRFQRNYYVYLSGEKAGITAKELGETVNITAGQVKQWEKVTFTTAHRMKNLTVTIHWDEGAEEALYLISSLSAGLCPHLVYEKRYAIETLFSNNKSRGFQLGRTHMTTPKHIDRLILAVAIATCITMGIGTHIIVIGQSKLIDRTDRRDLSLFQIGWRGIYRILALNRIKEMKIEFRFDFELPPAGF